MAGINEAGARHYGEILANDTGSLGEVKVNHSPLHEIGDTGLKRAAGNIDEEFLPALRGRKAVKVFKEMSLNDPTVGALLFAIEQLLRQVEWTVVIDDQTPEGQEAVEFVEGCMEDMSHTWDDMVAEALSFIVYGWSWHEIVYKKRVGPWETDPTKRSKFTDGRFGWRKIPIRSQETLLRWVFDEDGGIKAMIQMPPPTYSQRTIPIDRSLLFRARVAKGNPEGVSLLRTAYRPWFFKKRLEEFEAIGVERDLAGMPVARVPSDFFKAPKGSDKNKTFLAFKKMVQNVRRDEHEGLVIPREIDPETKQDLFDFELMSSGGARTFDTNALIQRYEQRILGAVLADWIMLGQTQTGSYAMHVDKTGVFRSALNTLAEIIADTFNRHAIPRLFAANGWKLETLPKIKPSNVDPPNLAELAQFMQSMAGLGMSFFPDPDLEKYLRATAHLPELSEEEMEQRQMMAQEQHMSQLMETMMQGEGMRQKTDLVGQGLTPEQAEMESQMPTERLKEQQMEEQAMSQQQDPSKDPETDKDAVQYQYDLAMKDRDLQMKDRDVKGKDIELATKEEKLREQMNRAKLAATPKPNAARKLPRPKR